MAGALVEPMQTLLLLGVVGLALVAWPHTSEGAPPSPAPSAPASGSGGSPALAGAVGPITGPVARQLVKEGALLLDVRTAAEFSGRHLDGALNIPVDALPAALAQLPKDRIIVVYCASGRRSARATAWLRAQGYDAKDLGPLDVW
jgi:rhodanese-related sulfurtransferase